MEGQRIKENRLIIFNIFTWKKSNAIFVFTRLSLLIIK